MFFWPTNTKPAENLKWTFAWHVLIKTLQERDQQVTKAILFETACKT